MDQDVRGYTNSAAALNSYICAPREHALQLPHRAVGGPRFRGRSGIHLLVIIQRAQVGTTRLRSALMALGKAPSEIDDATPRRTGTRAAETAARRSRILQAAVALARHGGYDAVQMRDVAAQAEVALGTLYRHYASKDQLLVAVMLDQTETLRHRLEQHPVPGGTAADRVSEVLRRACHSLERERKVTGALVRAMFATEPEVAETKMRVQREMQSIIATAIGNEVRDVDAIVDVLGNVWLAAMSFWVGGVTDGRPMSDRLTTAAHLLLQ